MVTDLASPQDAQTALQNRDSTARENLGVQALPVPNLGDRASVASTGDEVSLEVVIGARVLDVSLRGEYPTVTAAQKIAAAKALAAFVLARLP